MKAMEALEILKSKNTTLKLNHKIGNRDIAIKEVKDITKGIDNILPIIEQALTELEELKKNNQIILELLVKLLSMNMLGQEGLIIVNKIKNILNRSDKDE